MNKLRSLLQFLLGLALLSLIVLVSYGLIRFVWIGFVSLQSQVAIALLTASATVIVSVITVVVGKYLERKREIELQHREKKVEIYEKFMEKWFDILLSRQKQPSTSDKVGDEELVIFLTEFTRKLILWGSNGVVKKYAEFRRLGTAS